MNTKFDVEAFTNAYLAGNVAAQATPNAGLYQMADAAGHKRGTLEWKAFVAGGAAFIFKGHAFDARAI